MQPYVYCIITAFILISASLQHVCYASIWEQHRVVSKPIYSLSSFGSLLFFYLVFGLWKGAEEMFFLKHLLMLKMRRGRRRRGGRGREGGWRREWHI